jgi:hypothetical protein
MLPNSALAIIEPSKVRDYLLSQSHPVGRFKSVVFTAIGYTQENWQILRDDLLALARSGVAVPGQVSTYGQKYEVSGKLTGPNGRAASFTTVWLVRRDAPAPRFVTAFPG